MLIYLRGWVSVLKSHVWTLMLFLYYFRAWNKVLCWFPSTSILFPYYLRGWTRFWVAYKNFSMSILQLQDTDQIKLHKHTKFSIVKTLQLLVPQIIILSSNILLVKTVDYYLQLSTVFLLYEYLFQTRLWVLILVIYCYTFGIFPWLIRCSLDFKYVQCYWN